MSGAVLASPEFVPGDIVTRDGTDEHVVLGPAPSDPWFGVAVHVRCIKAPENGWIAIGEEEDNLPSRYRLVRRAAADDVSGDVSGDRSGAK